MRSILVLLTAMLLPFCDAAYSAEPFATVDSLSGKAFVSDNAMQWKAVSVGEKIYAGQTLSTGDESEVQLETEDGGIIAIRPDTEFRVDEYKAEGGPDDKIFMSLLKGAMRSITGWIGKYNAQGYRITTPSATIGIRGTDHETTVIEETDGDEAGTYDVVNEGETVLKTQYGERVVTPEKFAFAPRHRAIAPVFLAQKPMFWTKRKLVIEGLIPRRKALLRERIMQLREDRIKAVHERIQKQPHEKRLEQREKIRDERIRKNSRKTPAARGHDAKRAGQWKPGEWKPAGQGRIVRRKEAMRNRGDESPGRAGREQRPEPGLGRKNKKQGKAE